MNGSTAKVPDEPGGDVPDTPAHRRLVVGVVAGVLAGVIVALFAPWQLAVLAAWDLCAAVIFIWIFIDVSRLDATQTRLTVVAEDNSRRVTRLLVVFAATVSLVGVVLGYTKGRDTDGVLSVTLTVAAIATVVISWVVVHSVYVLRYAHLYYEEPRGGVDFKRPGYEPDFRDFAYLAFTIGMTFQVADTDLQIPEFRRTVLHHAMLSFLFGTVIIAFTINVIAGFVK